MNRIKRGEVFYVNKVPAQYMSEQEAGRPAVIVSNDMNNEYSEVVEVVYLTTKVKTDLPLPSLTSFLVSPSSSLAYSYLQHTQPFPIHSLCTEYFLLLMTC